MPEENPWTMPDVDLGELVLFTRRPGNPDWILARVRKVTPRAVDIMIEGSRNVFRGVRHRDDPYIKENPLCLEDSGIFVVSPSMVKLRKSLHAQEAQQAYLEKLAMEVEALRQKVDALSGQARQASKKTPGR